MQTITHFQGLLHTAQNHLIMRHKNLAALSIAVIMAAVFSAPLGAQAPKFDFFNPFATQNRVNAGTPWQNVPDTPVELPAGATAVLPEPLPDRENISLDDYNSAVAYAFESLHIIYGELEEEDAEAFYNMWSPLFDNPCQEIIDYLNKLNPLLSQFIVARESYIRSFRAALELLLDAGEASEWGDAAARDEAMSLASIYTRDMKSLQAAMTEIARRIQALGNPPNPFEFLRRNREIHDRIFKRKKNNFAGETWFGNRISTEFSAPGLPPLTEILPRYMFKAGTGDNEKYYVIQLIENRPESQAPADEQLKADENDLQGIKVKQIGTGSKSRPDFTSDATYQKYYPNPPVAAITSLGFSFSMQYQMSYLSDADKKNPEAAARKLAYHNAVGNYSARLSHTGIFFSTGISWGSQGKWDDYSYDNGIIPEKALRDFEEAVRQYFRDYLVQVKKTQKKMKDAYAQQDPPVLSEEEQKLKEMKDSVELAHQSIRESIRISEEQIDAYRISIRDEERRREAVLAEMGTAEGTHRQICADRLHQIDELIISYRSDITQLQNSIKSMETGTYYHKRTELEMRDFEQTIRSAVTECAHADACKRSIGILNEQIARMPEELQKDARERFGRVMFDEGALSARDYDKIWSLAKTYQGLAEASELKTQSEAEMEAEYAELKEYGAMGVTMSCGVLTGTGAARALAEAGASATQIIWGTRFISGLYGGATGYASGGPVEAVSSAARYFSPATSAIVAFVEGYTEAGPDATWSERIESGAESAAWDYVEGKVMDLGVNILAKGTTFLTKSFRTKFTTVDKKKLDMLRTNRQRLEAKDVVESFSKMNNEYITMLADGKTPQPVLDAKRAEINQLAASMNSDYHAKWYIKYKADRNLKAHFDQAVQANYREVIPEMVESMTKKGYNMKNLEFIPIRNSSSSGSSSMDLDLCPVDKKTKVEPKKFFNLDGDPVDTYKFMTDCQASLDEKYFKKFGISAKASELNLTTKAHPEAYSNDELLKKHINFENVTDEDIKSIGKVLEVKTTNIEGNIHYTETTRMQAKAREGEKEIRNMLKPYLESEAAKIDKSDRDAYIKIQEEIMHWEEMQYLLSQVGTATNDPAKLHKLDRLIRFKSGGKDTVGVVNELIKRFNPSYQVPVQ